MAPVGIDRVKGVLRRKGESDMAEKGQAGKEPRVDDGDTTLGGGSEAGRK